MMELLAKPRQIEEMTILVCGEILMSMLEGSFMIKWMLKGLKFGYQEYNG